MIYCRNRVFPCRLPRQRRFESEKYSWDFYEPLRATGSPRHTSSAINSNRIPGSSRACLTSSSQLAWEFFVARRYISGGIARADTSSREVPCRNLRFFLTRSQEVVRNGSVGSEVREGYTAGYNGRTDGRTNERMDGLTSRRPFRSLKQPVKVSGMRFLRSQI